MAITNGQIEAGAYYLNHTSMGDGAKTYHYFVMRVPIQPLEFQNDWDAPTANLKAFGLICRYKISHEIELDDNTEEFTFKWNLGGKDLAVDITYGDNVDPPAWQTAEEDDDFRPCRVYSNYASGLDYLKPRYKICELEVSRSDVDGGDDLYLYNVLFELIHNEAFDGEGMEMLKRSIGGNPRLYDADYPASSWMIKRVLCDTLEHEMYENRPAFSVPVFGDHPVV